MLYFLRAKIGKTCCCQSKHKIQHKTTKTPFICHMIHTMRWFGPNDPVSLMDIRQAGCTGVVTALHQIPVGEVWPVDAIRERIALIEADNNRYTPLHWTVVESLPVHEAIKKGLPERDQYIAHYRASLHNLSLCGVRTVCYNFMPVLDWSRTNLNYEMPDGARALRFVWEDFAAFDLCCLRRPGAARDYDPATQEAAVRRWAAMPEIEREKLQHTVLLGLPGSGEAFQLDTFQGLLDEYRNIGDTELREHLFHFIREVAPAAASAGIRLCIHPDDPPFPLLGLPRVVSTERDLAELLAACPIPANGLTFCVGSFGVRPDNDVPGMLRRFADHIYFLHLRNTKRERTDDITGKPLVFHEAAHLEGDTDMCAVIEAALTEENRRMALNWPDAQIPMRPDHGHQILDDLHKTTYPGYSAIGRLKGLAELRGVEQALLRKVK
jgi:mannonate dehydratase